MFRLSVHPRRNWRFVFVVISGLLLLGSDSIFGDQQHIAGVIGVDGKLNIATIVSSRSFRLFQGQGVEWSSCVLEIDDELLVTGAPLKLRAGTKEEPDQIRITTVSSNGRIIEATGSCGSKSNSRLQVAVISEDFATFPGGCDFILLEQESRKLMFAVSDKSNLIEFDFESRRISLVEDQERVVIPGTRIRTNQENPDELFFVDSRGNLVFYVRDPIRGWKGPLLIGTGFIAGSDLVVWRRPDGARELYVAAVNARGEVRLAKREVSGWKMEIAPGWVLPPGSSISVFHTPSNLRLFGVTAAGELISMHLANTEWRERKLGLGYRHKSTPCFPSESALALAMNQSGDLIALTNSDETWSRFLTPKDVGKQCGYVADQKWGSLTESEAEFQFWNHSDFNVVLRLRDVRYPIKHHDYELNSGSSISLNLCHSFERILSTQLKLSPNLAAGGNENRLESVSEIVTSSPCEIEILARAPVVSYIDERQHKYPQVNSVHHSTSSIGRFCVRAPVESLSKGPIQIDAVKSAAMRKIVSAE